MSKRIGSFYGSFLIFIAGCMLIPLFIALGYGEKNAAFSFGITILISIVPGVILNRLFTSSFRDTKAKLRESYFIVTTSWLVASVIGCLPYFISGSIPNIVDAFFETASGFTTTGSTILNDVEILPRSILFWRCFTQWLGGMGIMVLFAALLPSMGVKAQSIANVETPGPIASKISSHFSGTAQKLYIAYLILTVVLCALLMFGGMGLYDAVAHAMTAMATGGYSTYNDSIAHFHSNYISWVLTIFMVLAGTNFGLFFVAIHNGIRKVFKDEEFKLYIGTVVVSTALVLFSLVKSGTYTDVFQGLTDAAFQVVTIMTTTGYATTNFVKWPAFCQMLLAILMLTGASSSSTAGGIKTIRVLVFFKMVKREVKCALHGKIIDDIRLNGKKMSPVVLNYILTFLGLYIVVIILGTFLISITGDGNLVTNLTAVISCISNVGPGLDQVGPVCTYYFYSPFGKIVLSFIMIAGRLELSTFMIIFTRFFWNPNRV